MIVAGLICIFIAIFGVVNGGEILPSLIFAGIGILLIYHKLTEKERITERNKKRAIERKERIITSSKLRFNNSKFASHLIQNLRIRNWEDLNYNNGGCQVLLEEFVTSHKTYRYSDYGLQQLDAEGCEQLAVYIGELYGSEYRTEKITKCTGGYTGGYSGYIGSDGSVSVSRDWSGSERTIGYRLYSAASVPPPKPQGKNW